jgi:Meiotically up-regulated gene 113
MDKERIIREIQRTANANGGVVLGWRRFEEETGIRYYDWYGQYWTRLGDAVREAGFEPNRMSEAYSEDFLIERLATLTRRLGRVPTQQGDLVLAANSDPEFPSENVFRRLGSKAQRAVHVLAYCQSHPGYDDVAELWGRVPQIMPAPPTPESEHSPTAIGYVYMLKHGTRREYKIGRTNNPLRREGELGIQLPEKLEPVHYITTDDPSGVETYWHAVSPTSAKRVSGSC